MDSGTQHTYLVPVSPPLLDPASPVFGEFNILEWAAPTACSFTGLANCYCLFVGTACSCPGRVLAAALFLPTAKSRGQIPHPTQIILTKEGAIFFYFCFSLFIMLASLKLQLGTGTTTAPPLPSG